MGRRNTDEKKLLCNSIIQTDFKAKKMTRDKRISALMIEENTPGEWSGLTPSALISLNMR